MTMDTILNALKDCNTQVIAGVAALIGVVIGLVLAKLCCCSGKSAKKNCGCKDKKQNNKKGKENKDKKQDNREIRHTHPAPADGCVEIYVGNLSYDMTEEQLLKEFTAFGTVKSARIITNRFNNKSKGFGFVEMPNRPEAEKAIAALNDKDYLGRPMKVNEARNLEK